MTHNNFKKQYKRYSLLIIVLTMGVLIFFELTPFMSGLLGAMTIYVLLRNQMKYLTEKKGMGNSVAAIVLLLETITVFLIPLSLVVIILVEKIGNLNLDPQELISPIQHIVQAIQEKTGFNLFNLDNLSSMVSLLPQVGQYLMNGISSFMINIFVLIFVLYFMLTGRKKLEAYIYEILPFNEENKKEVLHETNMIVKSNAIGIPLLGVIQGVIATIGYYIFDAPSPLIFGFLTCIATVIPMVGTAIIWVPLVIYMAVIGEWGNTIGLALYAILVISQIDNLVRFMLQKKMADTHPLITIFGVVIGLSLFGFMGIIFGPLLLSMFILCFNIFKKEYLD